jgi:hypothetical protein
MRQTTLFEKPSGQEAVDAGRMILFALGDFQARGKVLAERDLPLDRLRGAFKRAAEAHGVKELPDEAVVRTLRTLGAEVREVPPFVAKHPYRVIVPIKLAERAQQAYPEILAALRQD